MGTPWAVHIMPGGGVSGVVNDRPPTAPGFASRALLFFAGSLAHGFSTEYLLRAFEL
jgi:hypothetical protein